MHCCERSREDPGNLEMVCERYGSKDRGLIAIGGADHRTVASMDTFPTPYLSNRLFSSIDNDRLHQLDLSSPWTTINHIKSIFFIMRQRSITSNWSFSSINNDQFRWINLFNQQTRINYINFIFSIKRQRSITSSQSFSSMYKDQLYEIKLSHP
jgi:hypothetical protein